MTKPIFHVVDPTYKDTDFIHSLHDKVEDILYELLDHKFNIGWSWDLVL